MILGAASVLLCGVSAYSALLRQHTEDYVTTPASGGRNSAVTTLSTAAATAVYWTRKKPAEDKSRLVTLSVTNREDEGLLRYYRQRVRSRSGGELL